MAGNHRCSYRTCAITTYTSPLMPFELCNICYSVSSTSGHCRDPRSITMFSLVFTPASHQVITTAPVELPNHNNVFTPASHMQTGSDVAATDRIPAPSSQLFTKSVIVLILSPDSQNFQFWGKQVLCNIWELLTQNQIMNSTF